MIKICNPKVHNWKIPKLEERHGSRCAIIIVNQESLEHLPNSNGVLDFGFEHIFLKVYKKENHALKSRDSNLKGEISQDGHMDVADDEKDKDPEPVPSLPLDRIWHRFSGCCLEDKEGIMDEKTTVRIIQRNLHHSKAE